jgi:hypothetical protein
MTEDLVLSQVVRKGAAFHRNRRKALPPAQVMDGSGTELFASAGLSREQDRGKAGGKQRNSL